MFSYTVRCEFRDPAVADEWVNWLNDGHLAEVCAAGAIDAEVVRFEGKPCICEARYHFESPETFAEYEDGEAPRLREVGLAQFPKERGLKYTRLTGEVVARA